MRPLLACLLVALSLPAVAQIYTYTDANGNTVYTNEPPQGSNAQTVNLPPTNTVAAQPSSNPAPSSNSNNAMDTPFSVLQLSGLPSDEAMRANNGSFSVDVTTLPDLGANQQLQLIVDGQPYGSPSSNPPLPVSNLPRGDHSLAVQVLSGGQAIQQSTAVTITVQRVNTQSPALRPKPVQPLPKPTPKPKPAG